MIQIVNQTGTATTKPARLCLLSQKKRQTIAAKAFDDAVKVLNRCADQARALTCHAREVSYQAGKRFTQAYKFEQDTA